MAYSIDLCRGWERIGHLTEDASAFTFNGEIRLLEQGQWTLSISDAAISWSNIVSDSVTRLATPEDVTEIRVVDGNRIVYAGLVRPSQQGGFGGLTANLDADGWRWTWTGVDLWFILLARLAFPNPATVEPWSSSHDVRSGVASTVLAEYLTNNLGSSALPARQLPGFGIVDQFVGTSGEWSARLQPLGDLAARICMDAGLVLRPTVDFDGDMTVTIGAPRDLSSSIVFSDQGDLTSVEARRVPLSASWTLAGGAGEGSSRAFRSADTGSTGWDRFEQFTDQSNLSSTSELQASANSNNALAGGSWAISAVPTDDAATRWKLGTDIQVGDFVSVQIRNVRHRVPVTAIAYSLESGRITVRPTLGDAVSDELDGLVRDVGDLSSRFRNDIS